MAPFVITVTGRAEIPHPAERALFHVCVASTGTNKAAVSDEVLTTARHIENLLREYSPHDNTVEAKQAAPLAHWSKTSMSASSFLPYTYGKSSQKPRQYNASIKFDIRFKGFKALGDFGSKISALSHVEVNGVDWILTSATEKAYRSQLCKEAARDALQKARDYCEVLGCENVRPVQLEEGQGFSQAAASQWNAHRMQQQMSYQQAQCAPGAAAADTNERDESPLEFRAEEVRMSMTVTVKFNADDHINSHVTMAKRPRVDDMEVV